MKKEIIFASILAAGMCFAVTACAPAEDFPPEPVVTEPEPEPVIEPVIEEDLNIVEDIEGSDGAAEAAEPELEGEVVEEEEEAPAPE